MTAQRSWNRSSSVCFEPIGMIRTAFFTRYPHVDTTHARTLLRVFRRVGDGVRNVCVHRHAAHTSALRSTLGAACSSRVCATCVGTDTLRTPRTDFPTRYPHVVAKRWITVINLFDPLRVRREGGRVVGADTVWIHPHVAHTHTAEHWRTFNIYRAHTVWVPPHVADTTLHKRSRFGSDRPPSPLLSLSLLSSSLCSLSPPLLSPSLSLSLLSHCSLSLEGRNAELL